MGVERINVQTLADLALDTLKRAIIDGGLTAGLAFSREARCVMPVAFQPLLRGSLATKQPRTARHMFVAQPWIAAPPSGGSQ